MRIGRMDGTTDLVDEGIGWTRREGLNAAAARMIGTHHGAFLSYPSLFPMAIASVEEDVRGGVAGGAGATSFWFKNPGAPCVD